MANILDILIYRVDVQLFVIMSNRTEKIIFTNLVVRIHIKDSKSNLLQTNGLTLYLNLAETVDHYFVDSGIEHFVVHIISPVKETTKFVCKSDVVPLREVLFQLMLI